MAIMPTCTLMTNLLISSTCVALHTQERSSGIHMNRAQNWPGSTLRRSEHSMTGKQLFAYRNDGEYTIDNLVAERTISNMTIQRKNSLFFCSDKGARNSVIYNTFISTCRQVGVSFRDYFRKLMKELGTGRTDYENLLPMTIGV